MEVVDPAATWIAEDDVLLRNAIEAGASLEALAKGAVRFSRRFTLRELRDRWHSLLYDPSESARASICMSEVEIINVGHASKLCKLASIIKESREKTTKRKTESIRRKYYAMRKRIRGQPFEDITFFGEPRVNGHADQGPYDYHLPVDQLGLNDSYLLGDHIITNSGFLESGQESMGLLEPVGDKDRLKADIVNMKMLPNYDLMYSGSGGVCPEFDEQEQHCFSSPIFDRLARLHSIGLSSPTSREPLWKMTEDVSAPVLPISINHRDKTQDAENMPNISDKDHDCLTNSANEGGLLLMDVDGSASVDKSCYDNLNSLLLSSPIYSHEEFVPNVSGSITKDACLALATSAAASPNTLDIPANPLLDRVGIQNNVCLDVIMPEPSSVQKTDCSDIQDLGIPCILNTEVDEVPNNDDIFPMGVVAAMQTLSQTTIETAAVVGSQKGNERVLERLSESPSRPVIVLGARPIMLLKASSNHGTKSSTKVEFPDASALIGKHAKNSQILPDNRKAAKSSSSVVVGDLEGNRVLLNIRYDNSLTVKAEFMQSVNVSAEHFWHSAHNLFCKQKPGAPDFKFGELTMSGQIPDLSPEEEEFESDDDVPYFSDVEAMVLEMDLCASDQDPSTSTRVSHYQDEGAKKHIMRLEQCARSYMDRRIESHGAFAILYGWRLKHYIRKSEVILGRATVDMEVDVDLARLGRANKISRQQASIKLEVDGSFTVKNLGKFSIFVNGKELGTGQFMTLSLSNLIEIRGMSFFF